MVLVVTNDNVDMNLYARSYTLVKGRPGRFGEGDYRSHRKTPVHSRTDRPKTKNAATLIPQLIRVGLCSEAEHQKTSRPSTPQAARLRDCEIGKFNTKATGQLTCGCSTAPQMKFPERRNMLTAGRIETSPSSHPQLLWAAAGGLLLLGLLLNFVHQLPCFFAYHICNYLHEKTIVVPEER